MAMADLMVVMEDGVIRQAGPPREVFERPASAFIARFIGGHNVLPSERGPIAVRADRCRLGVAAGGAACVRPRRGGRISGRHGAGRAGDKRRRRGLRTGAGREFYARPVEPGEAATLVWSERDAHVLAER